MRAFADGVDPDETSVMAYTTEEPVMVEPDTDVDEALTTMLDVGVRHLLVGRGAQVMGMLSLRTCLAFPSERVSGDPWLIPGVQMFERRDLTH